MKSGGKADSGNLRRLFGWRPAGYRRNVAYMRRQSTSIPSWLANQCWPVAIIVINISWPAHGPSIPAASILCVPAVMAIRRGGYLAVSIPRYLDGAKRRLS